MVVPDRNSRSEANMESLHARAAEKQCSQNLALTKNGGHCAFLLRAVMALSLEGRMRLERVFYQK